MKTIYLISCVSKKASGTTQAMNMYQSDWFRKAWKYCINHKLNTSDIYILSAEYGLLTPFQLISPYEKTLNTMSSLDRKKWADMVFAQLSHKEKFKTITNVVFLAGNRYREYLIPMLEKISGVSIHTPMQGLGIGQQLAWLNAEKNIIHDFDR